MAGHTFSLVRHDDSSRPEDTVAQTQKLLADAKPIALAGYFGNRNLTELIKTGLLDKEKIPLVGYRSTELRGDVPYLYSVRAGLRDEVSRIAEHLVTVGVTRLGVFHEEGPGTAQLLAMLDEVVKRTGATITVRATYPAGTARVAGAIEAFIKAQPQAIIILATGSAAAGFIEQYRLGGGAAQLFAQSGADICLVARRSEVASTICTAWAKRSSTRMPSTKPRTASAVPAKKKLMPSSASKIVPFRPAATACAWSRSRNSAASGSGTNL